MTTLADIIPKTLGLLHEHLPPCISDMVGRYLISVITVHEQAQLMAAAGWEKWIPAGAPSEIRWRDPEWPLLAYNHPAAQIKDESRCALYTAAVNGYGELVDALVRWGIDIDDEMLFDIYKKDTYDMYRVIIKHPHFRDWNALLIVGAAHELMSDVVEACMHGADNLDVALRISCKKGNDEISEYLINHGAQNCTWHEDSRDRRRAGCFARVLGQLGGDDSEEEDVENDEAEQVAAL